MKKILSLTLICQFISLSSVYAKGVKDAQIEELVLPTEVNKLQKRSGSIYYSKAVKNKVLIPTNFWGEVESSGLHFLPEGTSLVKGLSMAGGPTGDASMNNVKVTRKSGKSLEVLEFDLQEGGGKDAHGFVLNPGDVVFVERERFYENRAYYTGLIQVLTTLITGALLYEQVND